MDPGTWKSKNLKCEICKDFLKQPTALPCGHVFCLECISEEWKRAIYEVIYSCPTCAMTFPSIPDFTIYETLAIKRKLKQGSKDDSGQNTVLTELKLKFQQPQPQVKDKMKAKESLWEILCVHHKKILNHYCFDEEKCICEECTLSEHREHDTVPAAEERRVREQMVKEFLLKTRREIHAREFHLQKISNTFEYVKSSSQSAVEANERLFTEMIMSLETMKAELNKTIREQEKALLSQAQLEERQQRGVIMSLQAKTADLEALSQVKQDIPFIKKSQEILNQQEADPVISHISENLSFDFVKMAISKVKLMVEDGCKDAIESIQKTVRNVKVAKDSEEKQEEMIQPPKLVQRSSSNVSGPRPTIELRQKQKMRHEFLKHTCPLTLDPDTAHPTLSISDDNAKVSICAKRSKKKPFPQRFDSWEQALCKEGLRGGRFYWEVEWSGKGVYIGVALEDFPRKGKGQECGLGHNANSWCLHCSNTTYSTWHNGVTSILPVTVFSPRLGIYLDYKAGSLEFYTISDQMTFLHRFTLENVSGHLYPAFGFGLGLGLQAAIKICKLEANEKYFKHTE